MKYTLAIDQSTSATKAMLFTDDGKIAFSASKAHEQFYPKAGWVEHDPTQILDNCYSIIEELILENGIKSSAISSIAITNQRETVVVWNKLTGKPVYNAIVWQCNRGTEICEKLIDERKEELVSAKTGLIINPYFSASGIQWILDEVKGIREEAEAGNLLFGTMDSWLIWNFTQGKVHATDHTNASRTLLYNIHALQWDQELLELFHIPAGMCPQVLSSDSVYGTTKLGFFETEIPIAGVLGDSHGALAGQMCFEAGMGKSTFGTGSSMMIQIGDQALPSPKGLVTSVAYSCLDKVYFAYEGNIHCTGATIQWLIDDLELISSASESEILAISVDSTDGVYLVPAFAGLGAPWWDHEARAMVCGMTRGTKKAHFVRAALESIAYQVRDLMSLIKQSGVVLKELRVDGGPVKNNFLMQFLADQLQSSINRSPVQEASALGAIFMNGLALKKWKDLSDIARLRNQDEYIDPQSSAQRADELYIGWKKAISKTLTR